MSRFGKDSIELIKEEIDKNVPRNTKKSKQYVWKQFTTFCEERKYLLDEATPVERLNFILMDWGFNMRKIDGSDYKECVVKTIWNTSAKLLQEKYYNEYGRSFDPFKDIIFQTARNARDTKRKLLQGNAPKRKIKSAPLTHEEHQAICRQWDEDTPAGLQKKFFHIAAAELDWKGCEAANCLLDFFKEELDNKGAPTGRIEYNTDFSKTCRKEDEPCASSKWLIKNVQNSTMCPVRLYKKLISKRGKNVTTNKLFLSVNGHWKPRLPCIPSYKNMPLGINTINKWIQTSAQSIRLDVKKQRVTHQSNQATAIIICIV